MTIEELRQRVTISIPEAGRVCGLGSDSAAYRAAAKGTLPGVRQLGARKVVSVPILLAWLLDEEPPSSHEEEERVSA